VSTAIYCRISRDLAGESLGVQRQEAECRELAKRLGLDVSDVYVDNDISATSGKTRPAFERLLASQHKTVLVWAQDRLLRVSSDLERVLDAGMTVHSVQAGTLDLSTPQGKAVARTVAAWSTYETEMKAQRQRAANRQRRASGERHRGGARTFGYTRSMEHDPTEAPALADAYAHILSGGSVASIVKRWNEAGLPTSHGNEWNRSGVRRALLNPTNAGLSSYKREVIGEGFWEPIVDRETWEAVKTILEAPERITYRTDGRRRYLLPGLLTCGICGGVMSTGRSGGNTRTYVCARSRHLSRKADDVDQYVTAQFLHHLRSTSWKPEVTAPAQESIDTSGIESKLADLALAYAEDRITLAQMEMASKALRERLDAAVGQRSQDYTKGVLKPFLVSPMEAWENTEVEQRRAAIEARMQSITIRPVQRGTRKFQPESVDIQWKATKGES